MENIYSENLISTEDEDAINADQNLSEDYQTLAKLDIMLHSCYTKIKKDNSSNPKTMFSANKQVVS